MVFLILRIIDLSVHLFHEVIYGYTFIYVYIYYEYILKSYKIGLLVPTDGGKLAM